MQAFKSEIDTIKGILLNRKQFASPGSSSGIPSWQLSKKKKEKHDDTGSAHSNSSENDTEVIPEEGSQKRSPANSDSSLEIM
jgi:peroxin-14